MQQDYTQKYEKEYLDLGKHIAFYREKRKMSQEELAEKVNSNRVYIQKIEGDYTATRSWMKFIWSVKNLDFFFAIADALQMDIIAFFKPTTEENFQKYRRDH